MIIGSLLRYGGTEKHLTQLIQGLKQKFNFVIYHVNPKTGQAFDILSAKAKIYNLNYFKSLSGISNSVINTYKMLRKEKPDLIYCTSLIGLILVLPFSIFNRIPIISARRSLYDKSTYSWSIWTKKPIFWLNNIASKKIIGNSDAVGKLIFRDAFSKKKYITIKNGLDLEQFSIIDKSAVRNFSEEFNLKKENFVIGSIGNYRSVKNYKQLIQAAKHVSISREKIKFIIIGEGIEYSYMKDMIKSNNLEDIVFLTGYRSNLSEILSIINIFVMTSITEGSPNALIEACAMRKLVIGTDVPSINEIIKHKKNGFLVPLHDDLVLANLIIKLHDNFQDMDHIREEAYKTVVNDYGINTNLERFYKVFSEVINNK